MNPRVAAKERMERERVRGKTQLSSEVVHGVGNGTSGNHPNPSRLLRSQRSFAAKFPVQLHPKLSPQFKHLKQAPFRTVMCPQLGQLGASP